MAEQVDYTSRAEARIIEVLEAEHAVVFMELQARISEAGFEGSGFNIDPHHVSNGLKNLIERGTVTRESGETRGGRVVETIQLAEQGRKKTAIERAARRKRLLHARYLGWAQGTQRYPQGLVGPAGEQAVRTGLRDSGRFLPATPDYGEVSTLLNVTLPGSLDSGGYSLPFENGLPGTPLTTLIEVKNIRGWIYPHSEELYQLLDKALVIQDAHPDQPILPVFVCRKVQKPTFWMASQLGFMVIELGVQFLGDTIEQTAFDEVRVELDFDDLRLGYGPSLRIRDRFQRTVPVHGPAIAAAWKRTTENHYIAHHIHELRYAEGYDRTPLMEQLRQHVKDAGHQGF